MTYLLPYLGFSDEYHMCDFGKEWNSEGNLAVASRLGGKLNCKFDSSRDRSYFLLGEICEHIDPFEAGRVVEIHESEVQLLEPVPQKAKKALMAKHRQNADLHKSKNLEILSFEWGNEKVDVPRLCDQHV